MNTSEEFATFAQFFNSRLKERGLTLQKLSEVSGIAITHLEHLSRGELNRLPPAPYLRGYLEKLSAILDLDAAGWWERIKKEQVVTRSGETDQLPHNRFAQELPRWRAWVAIAGILIALYFGLRFSEVFGRPRLVILSPADVSVTVNRDTLTLQGTLANADTLTVNGEEITVEQNTREWRKDVALQPGLNTFEVRARKFLGRETAVMRQIFYRPSQPVVPELP